MNTQWTEQVAKDNYSSYKEYARYRAPWERDARRCDDFRYGSHFSRLEEEELIKFRQAPIPINITTAICDTADAYMNSSKPIIRVAPIIYPYDDIQTANSKSVSAVYNNLLQKSWYDSLGGLHSMRVIRDSTNVGHGLFLVVPRNEYGEFSVDWKHLSWRYFYPDPQAKDPFYRDSDAMVYAMVISEKAGYKFVRSMESDVTEAQYQENWVKNNRVAPATLQLPTKYSPNFGVKDRGILFIVKMTLEEQVSYKVIPRSIDLKKTGKMLDFRTYQEITPELEALRTEGLIDIEESRELRLTEYTSVGGLGFKKVYPIDSYNIVPLTYDHRDNPYPLGRVWYLYSLQRALNKFIMIAVLNGTLMNASKILAEEGSISDLNEFKKNFAQPLSVNFWKKVSPQTERPQVMEARPLDAAWLTMPKYLAYIMEYVSGIFGIMQGDTSSAPTVFSTVASLQSAGGIKIKNRMQQVDATLSVVGEVAGKFYREYAPPQGFAMSIDESGQLVEQIKYNTLRAVIDNKTGKVTPQVEVDPATDLSLGFRSVRFTSQGSNGYEASTEAAMLTTLATQLSVPELVPLILKRLNLTDVDGVIKQIMAKGDLASQNQQLTQMVKELDSRTKILANQVQQQMISVGAIKEIGKIKDELRNAADNVLRGNAPMNGNQ